MLCFQIVQLMLPIKVLLKTTSKFVFYKSTARVYHGRGGLKILESFRPSSAHVDLEHK